MADADLAAALDELLSDAESLTRSLLGSATGVEVDVEAETAG